MEVPEGTFMPFTMSSLSAWRTVMATVISNEETRSLEMVRESGREGGLGNGREGREGKGNEQDRPGGMKRTTSRQTLFKYFSDSTCSNEGE